jgi:hypothetical protein
MWVKTLYKGEGAIYTDVGRVHRRRRLRRRGRRYLRKKEDVTAFQLSRGRVDTLVSRDVTIRHG